MAGDEVLTDERTVALRHALLLANNDDNRGEAFQDIMLLTSQASTAPGMLTAFYA